MRNCAGSGNNTLTLNQRDVLNLSDESNTLVVPCDAGDVVHIGSIGSGWTQGANQTIGADTFSVFTQGSATLKVSISGSIFFVTPTSGLITSEAGGQATFTVRLGSPPTATVTIPVSSSDTTEGIVSTSSLTFDSGNWNQPQTVTITGVDDNLFDGSIVYAIVLGAATSTDSFYNGLDPTDVTVTNTDNETKFYVVNDASTDQTYRYDTVGNSIGNSALNTGNTAPRGAASTAAGDKVWVVDANRKVFVYNTSGGILGSWTAGSLNASAQPEGITTNGTDVWIVDDKTDKVYRYANAASLTSGSPTAASSFSLNSGNTNPKDLLTDGLSIWVVNDSSSDKVFKYTVSGSPLGSWTINSGGGSPTGMTIDPTNVSNIWIVDSATDRVYQYNNATGLTSGSKSPDTSWALAAGNTNPQGIADPPAPTSMQPDKTTTSASSMAGTVDFAVARLFDFSTRLEPSQTFEYDRTESTQLPTQSAPTYRLAELPTQQIHQLAASENRGASAAKGLARSTDDIFSSWNADELEVFDL